MIYEPLSREQYSHVSDKEFEQLEIDNRWLFDAALKYVEGVVERFNRISQHMPDVDHEILNVGLSVFGTTIKMMILCADDLQLVRGPNDVVYGINNAFATAQDVLATKYENQSSGKPN